LHKLLLLPKRTDFKKYLDLLNSANLQAIEIVESPVSDVEIVFGEPSLIVQILGELPKLKWVQSTWAGVEPLLNPALRRDYLLTNARGVFGGLMSEFVFGYLLFYERKILQRLDAQRTSRWEPVVTRTLRGKTIGLLGVGSIGSSLASTATHFGMHVLGYTRASETCLHVDKYFHGKELLSFAKNLDILVNVLPNTPSTQNIINKELLEALPEGAYFFNVGRGSALDEYALIEALGSGHIAMAVLDVLAQEPLPPEHPLWHAKNVYITSHTAAPSFPEDLVALFVQNYNKFITNQMLDYIVNFDLGY